jgi:hypothetical protein
MARKPPSPQKLKQQAANRRPYTPAQLMAYVYCPCDVVGRPSQKVMDEAADRAFSGGYDIRRSNICPRCHLAKPVNGPCCS